MLLSHALLYYAVASYHASHVRVDIYEVIDVHASRACHTLLCTAEARGTLQAGRHGSQEDAQSKANDLHNYQYTTETDGGPLSLVLEDALGMHPHAHGLRRGKDDKEDKTDNKIDDKEAKSTKVQVAKVAKVKAAKVKKVKARKASSACWPIPTLQLSEQQGPNTGGFPLVVTFDVEDPKNKDCEDLGTATTDFSVFWGGVAVDPDQLQVIPGAVVLLSVPSVPVLDSSKEWEYRPIMISMNTQVCDDSQLAACDGKKLWCCLSSCLHILSRFNRMPGGANVQCRVSTYCRCTV